MTIEAYICWDCAKQFKGRAQATRHVRVVHQREPRYKAKWQVTVTMSSVNTDA